MEKDIFCKIIEGEMDTDFLFETEQLVVFKDIAPKAPVHYLVVPKKHITTINDAEEEDRELLGNMMLAGKRTAKETGVEDGYKLIFNVGKNGGQEVPHIHLHILGGWGK
ncbi:MAG: histidine triad nucleotide-binding protein [Candidatus Spechtbacterales bacterium]|nr:histidine triad nucleotide-binding protein [Candidatus Spechtbacterales bacterium]